MVNRPARVAPVEPRQLVSFYLTAKEVVINAGFADEIDWQEEVSLTRLDESTFLRESAWVVLSAGFREEVLRRCFKQISAAFLYWSSADSIVCQRETCRMNALAAFRNERKIDAILRISERVADIGIDMVHQQIRNRGVEFLREFPFIGPITVCHLAKNLGLQTVKPDRHLRRMATENGYESADRMCWTISEVVGDSLPVIDIVMWRYATLQAVNGRFDWRDAS